MRGMLALLAGVLLVATGSQGDVTAQDRRLPPNAVGDEVWQSFADAVEADPDTKRRAHLRRAEFEPVLEKWQEELNAVFTPQWEYALRGREIEGGEHRWTLEKTRYDTMVGTFDVFVLHQAGGGQFRQTYTVPQEKVDELDFEFAGSVRQGTPFDARVEEFARQLWTADAALVQLCDMAGSDYSMPAGSRVKGNGGIDRNHTQFQFRDRSIRRCILNIASSVGWKASITDGKGKLQEAVTFEHLEKWFEAKGGNEEADTWRNAMKNLLKLKLVKIETEDLFVHVRDSDSDD